MFSSEAGLALLLGEKEKPKAKERKKKRKRNPSLNSFLPSIMFQKYLE